MINLSDQDDLSRQRYVEAHAPAFLAQILTGALATDRLSHKDAASRCAAMAIEAAGALYDQLAVSAR